MLVHFDFASGVPLYRQLRDQIVLGLAEGRLAPGEKLPPVRVLAEESGVNMHTHCRAVHRHDNFHARERSGSRQSA